MLKAIRNMEETVVNLSNACGGVYNVRLIGASFPLFAQRGVSYGTITVSSPEPYCLGVIAIAIETSQKTKPWVYRLLSVTWLGNPAQLWVDVEVDFRPNSLRLGQIDTNGVIEVQVGDDIYTTASQNGGRAVGRISADYACAYMAGVLSGDEIRARSQEFEQQQSELEQLRVLCAERGLSEAAQERYVRRIEAENRELVLCGERLELDRCFWKGMATLMWRSLGWMRFLLGKKVKVAATFHRFQAALSDKARLEKNENYACSIAGRTDADYEG
jgi:hypothetical protein